jgi:hypothetical protein
MPRANRLFCWAISDILLTAVANGNFLLKFARDHRRYRAAAIDKYHRIDADSGGCKHGPGGRSRLSAERMDVLLSAVEKTKGRASFRSLGPARAPRGANGLELNDPGV